MVPSIPADIGMPILHPQSRGRPCVESVPARSPPRSLRSERSFSQPSPPSAPSRAHRAGRAHRGADRRVRRDAELDRGRRPPLPGSRPARPCRAHAARPHARTAPRRSPGRAGARPTASRKHSKGPPDRAACPQCRGRDRRDGWRPPPLSRRGPGAGRSDPAPLLGLQRGGQPRMPDRALDRPRRARTASPRRACRGCRPCDYNPGSDPAEMELSRIETPAGRRPRRAPPWTRRRSRRPWSRPSRPPAPAPSGGSSTGSCAR